MKEREPNPFGCKKFEEEMDIAPIEIPLDDCTLVHTGKPDDVLADFKTVRESVFKSVVRASELIDEAVKMVKGNPFPKQIEAASTCIKALAENAEKLLDIHEKIQKIEAAQKLEKAEDAPERPKFVGNLRDITKELQKKVENG